MSSDVLFVLMKISLHFFCLFTCFLWKINAKPCSDVRLNLTWGTRIVEYYGASNPLNNYCRQEKKGSSFHQTQHRFLALSSARLRLKILLVYAAVTAASTTNIVEQLFLEFQDVQEKNKNLGCCDRFNGFIAIIKYMLKIIWCKITQNGIIKTKNNSAFKVPCPTAVQVFIFYKSPDGTKKMTRLL